MKKYLVPAIFTLLIVGVLIFAVRAATTNSNDAKPSDTNPAAAQLGDEQKQKLKEGQKKGNPDAKVVITEFADFQCPACKAFAPALTDIEKANSGKVLLVFKHFPLYPQPHKNARVSAYAAESAGKQGKFWEMYSLLYEKQDDWAEQDDPSGKFAEYAQQIGLDVDQFKKDLAAEFGKSRVDADRDFASQLKLRGTPSIFVNGEQFDLASGGAAGLKKLIDQKVAEAYGQTSPQQ